MPNTKLADVIDSLYPRLQRLAVLLFILIALLFVLLTNPANGDENTGQLQDDPKDLAPAPAPTLTLCSNGGNSFQPLPGWARSSVMPALPDKLLPMGRKVVVMTTPPTPAPLAPPKDVTAPELTAAKPTPPPSPSPALIAVSPFLQWIQSNPDAAAQARQQANAYRPAPAPETAVTENGANAPTGSVPPAPPHAPAPVDPYWLPPLIDAAPFGVQTGSSAAIYTTPQR